MQKQMIYAGLFLVGAQAMKIQQLVEEAASTTPDAQCAGQDDPACTMFADGFDEEDTLALTYFNAYRSGKDLGAKYCKEGNHDYTPAN